MYDVRSVYKVRAASNRPCPDGASQKYQHDEASTPERIIPGWMEFNVKLNKGHAFL